MTDGFRNQQACKILDSIVSDSFRWSTRCVNVLLSIAGEIELRGLMLATNNSVFMQSLMGFHHVLHCLNDINHRAGYNSVDYSPETG